MLKIDELNIVSKKSIPYRQYFSKMELPERDIEDRIEFAQKFERIIASVFQIIGIVALTGTIAELKTEELIESFTREYNKLCIEYGLYDDYTTKYTEFIANEIVQTTVERIVRAIEDGKDDTRYSESLSMDRAVYVAENESNTILNYRDYLDAKASGKTQKQWVDVRDSHERISHIEVGGSVIGIDEPFTVGNSQMYFPKDTSLGAGAEELVNCRCSLRYL